MNEHLIQLISKVWLFGEEDPNRVLEHLEECPIEDYAQGEYIMRAGEYDENCCLLLKGKARVDLPDETPEMGDEKLMREGDFFGEIAALSGVPRSADIVAVEPCAVIEIPKTKMFSLLDDLPSVRARIDKVYKDRVLNNQLAKISIFSGLPEDILDRLKEKASIQSFKSGEVIFHQEDEADAFYMVLFGFVKVSQSTGAKTKILAYLQGKQYFGEFALLSDGGKRTATVTAISRTHVTKISRNDFLALLDEFPSIKHSLKEAEKRRIAQGKKISRDAHMAGTLRAAVETGIIQTGSAHLLDTTKCIQCDICVEACATLHDGVSRLTRKGIRLNGFLMAATSCRHCEDPACMYKCPTGAIARDTSGEIYHKDFCIGCGACAKNCPHGNIILVDVKSEAKMGYLAKLVDSIIGSPLAKSGAKNCEKPNEAQHGRIHKTRKKVVKCDMCRDFDFLGCVYNCPTGAMIIVNPAEYFSELIPIE